MKYIKVFNNQAEYQSFKNSNNFLRPNLSAIKVGDFIHYNPFIPPPPKVGDIVYVDKLKQTSYVDYTYWNDTLGTPIGIVVIPPDFLPDGLLRIMSYKPVNESSDLTTSTEGLPWCTSSVDTPLVNYTKIPTTDNKGSTSTGSSDVAGYAPTDVNTTSTVSYVDSKAKYYNSPYIPSPYKTSGSTEVFNTDFNRTISGNNACSDFNGYSNTQTLVSLDSSYGEYVAANAAWNYDTGVKQCLWYLPSAGEGVVMMARVGVINNAIAKLNGLQISSSYNLWTSTEYSSTIAIRINYLGTVSKNSGNKINHLNLVYPFAIIDNL